MTTPAESREVRRRNGSGFVKQSAMSRGEWLAFCPSCAASGKWLVTRAAALADLELHQQSDMHAFWTGTDPAPESWFDVPGDWRNR